MGNVNLVLFKVLFGTTQTYSWVISTFGEKSANILYQNLHPLPCILFNLSYFNYDNQELQETRFELLEEEAWKTWMCLKLSIILHLSM